MTNILTTAEAANTLRIAEDDPNLLIVLPLVDEYIRGATGRDWTGDSPIADAAKGAARIVLVRMFENPGAAGLEPAAFGWGLTSCLLQLEMLGKRYRTFEGINGGGYIFLDWARVGDSVLSVVGRVGSSGDQSANFESIITVDNCIKQISSDDLSGKWFTAYVVSPEDV